MAHRLGVVAMRARRRSAAVADVLVLALLVGGLTAGVVAAAAGAGAPRSPTGDCWPPAAASTSSSP